VSSLLLDQIQNENSAQLKSIRLPEGADRVFTSCRRLRVYRGGWAQRQVKARQAGTNRLVFSWYKDSFIREKEFILPQMNRNRGFFSSRKSCFFLYLGLFWLYSDCSEAAFQFTNRKLGAPLEIDYRISLLDIGIGVAQAEGDIGGGHYRLTVKARATGMAGWLTGTVAEAFSMGSAMGPRVVPSNHGLDFSGQKNSFQLRMGLVGGAVTQVRIDPPLVPRDDRVPVEEAHRRNVIDPVGATIFLQSQRSATPDPAVCNRTVPVFDGVGRFDISLTYKETKPLKMMGFNGPVLVCAVRYTPVSGHRLNRPAVEFMRENKDIEVWLALVPGTRALVPVRILVKTMIGGLEIEATRFGAVAADKIAPEPLGAEAPQSR
jgi:hypothetical protein